MRVFVDEFVTGGGFWHLSTSPANSPLAAEARAMSRAITADFAACDGIEVATTRDTRLPEYHSDAVSVVKISSATEDSSAIERLATWADWTLLIAPESGGSLAARCQMVESRGGRLLSPSSAVVEIAANKQATARWLTRAGVPVPRAYCPATGEIAFETPLIQKPLDGCGSQDIRLIHDRGSFDRGCAGFYFEEFIPGLPASVAVLRGPAGDHALLCCEQRLSRDGRFTYLGGRLPLPPTLNERARRLALAAVSALPPCVGYVGVDLVLGEAGDGSGDRVIEVNPRLTTSYVGLRAASQTNLAAAMLAVAEGGTPRLSFADRSIVFTADGRIVE